MASFIAIRYGDGEAIANGMRVKSRLWFNVNRHSSHPMQLRFVLLVLGIFLVPGSVAAFERDVHFGLTKWLALQAGFNVPQADAIATGDQRVDSGDIQYIEPVSI